jgi:hypothetical protein
MLRVSGKVASLGYTAATEDSARKHDDTVEDCSPSLVEDDARLANRQFARSVQKKACRLSVGSSAIDDNGRVRSTEPRTAVLRRDVNSRPTTACTRSPYGLLDCMHQKDGP